MLRNNKLRRRISFRKPPTFTNSKILRLAQKELHSKSTYFYRRVSKNQRLFYAIPSICGLALLVGGFMLFNPTGRNLALATGDNVTTDTPSSISLSFPTEDLPNDFDNSPDRITQVTAGEIAYRSNILRVSAKNIAAYQLYIQSANGYDSNLRGQSNPNATISGVGNNIYPINFKNNSWGYSFNVREQNGDSNVNIEELAYSTLPENKTTPQPLYESGPVIEESKDFQINFAAKIGPDSPADHYQTKILLSVAAKPSETAALFSEITTMQEMTTETCKSATIGDTKRLRDTRDGKMYWVAKLKDDNCWMTQNLDLDLSNEITLKPSSTEIASNWTPNTSTMDDLAAWKNGNYDSFKYIQSYDPGMYVYTQPTRWIQCRSNNADPSSLSQCVGDTYKWQDVDNINEWTPATTDYNADSTSPIVANNETKEYDAHYLVGNYYSFLAATAGTGGSGINSAFTEYSICPKGWKLPLSGSGGSGNPSYNNTSDSFYYMLSKYGVQQGATGTADGKSYDVKLSPLYFVPNGEVQTNIINYAGYNANLWSSAAVATNGSSNTAYYNAFYLRISYGSTVEPSMYAWTHSNGMTIRCLAK